MWETIAAVGGGGTLGVVLTKLFDWLRGSKADANQYDLASRDQIRKETNEIFERMKADYREVKSEVAESRKRESECQVQLAEVREELGVVRQELATEKIRGEWIESELIRAKIDFRPWTKPGTDEHTPLETINE